MCHYAAEDVFRLDESKLLQFVSLKSHYSVINLVRHDKVGGFQRILHNLTIIQPNLFLNLGFGAPTILEREHIEFFIMEEMGNKFLIGYINSSILVEDGVSRFFWFATILFFPASAQHFIRLFFSI